MSKGTSTEEKPPTTATQPNGDTGFQIIRTELVWPGKYNEDGALMAATVLNSPRAVAMSLYIIQPLRRYQ